MNSVVEGQVLDTRGTEILAKMPSRVELQGQIVLIAKSPAARIAGQIAASAARIAGCVKARAEQLEKETGSSVAA